MSRRTVGVEGERLIFVRHVHPRVLLEHLQPFRPECGEFFGPSHRELHRLFTSGLGARQEVAAVGLRLVREGALVERFDIVKSGIFQRK